MFYCIVEKIFAVYLLLHLLGGLGEPLLVEGVHQHDLVIDHRSADGRTEEV